MFTIQRIAVLVKGDTRKGIVATLNDDPGHGVYAFPHPDDIGCGIGSQIALGAVTVEGVVARLGPPTLVSEYDAHEHMTPERSDIAVHVGALIGFLDLRDIAGKLPVPYVLDADPTPLDPETGLPFDMMGLALATVG